MQYFRNMPRRAMDYQNPRNSDMFPLCRNDRDERTDGVHERQNGCGCAGNTRNTETERSGSCGCANKNRSAENNRSEHSGSCGYTSDERSTENERSCRLGCLGNNRIRENENLERQGTCGCETETRSEDYGCTGLAMAFVPEQEFSELNDAEEALCRGTLFRKLDMPFYGQRRRNCK